MQLDSFRTLGRSGLKVSQPCLGHAKTATTSIILGVSFEMHEELGC